MKRLKEKVGIIKKIEMQEIRPELRKVLKKKWEDSDKRHKFENFFEFEEKYLNKFLSNDESSVRFYRNLARDFQKKTTTQQELNKVIEQTAYAMGENNNDIDKGKVQFHTVCDFIQSLIQAISVHFIDGVLYTKFTLYEIKILSNAQKSRFIIGRF